MNLKKAPVSCPPVALFEVIEQDLKIGICCDIIFSVNGKKHQIGAWGDNGNTYTNTKFYFDKQVFATLEELKANAKIDDSSLLDYPHMITVHECDACYPRGDKILNEYYLKSMCIK